MSSNFHRKSCAAVLLACGLCSSALVLAKDDTALVAHPVDVRPAPAAVAVRGDLAALPTDVAELKFREFFKMPIGPRGLDASDKLIALADKRVRIVGYMARAETPVAGMFILTPLPVSLGDEDESLSDDLPASSVFVHLNPNAEQAPLPYYPGLLQLTGTLRLGPFEEADGHVSTVRLELDPNLARAMTPQQLATAEAQHAAPRQSPKQAPKQEQHAKK
ncbi:hypothetical protein [Actimicrobium sp. GrIS 1.19]|uniref:hypothetical protein n=1 Tax=Actimicrobium sp. GrIS 1.19 TaxID=3071708 RepID=UPI002E0FBD48